MDRQKKESENDTCCEICRMKRVSWKLTFGKYWLPYDLLNEKGFLEDDFRSKRWSRTTVVFRITLTRTITLY